MTTPPPSNLGPLSEPWGREITQQVQANATAIQRLGGDFSNDGSVNNSTLDNIAYQINELQQRQSGVVFHPEVQTVSFTQPQLVTNILTLQIPAPDVRRVGWVALQFTAVNSNNLQTEIYASFEMDGTVFHRDSRAIPSRNLEPSSWEGQKAISGYTGFIAEPGAGGLIRMTLQAEAALSNGARTVRYTNIQANYQYGQAI